MDDSYIASFVGKYSPKQYQRLRTIDGDLFEAFRVDVKRAVLMASIIQDIGNFHPEAQLILNGESGNLDPYRTLELDDRKNYFR